jgi:hypothetical protein
MHTVAVLTPAALALLLLAAHCFRAGLVPLAALGVALVGLLFVRSPWSARLLLWALALGVLEWLRTAWVFAAARAALGQPYTRLLAILGAVALLTALAALLLRSAAARRHFGAAP